MATASASRGAPAPSRAPASERPRLRVVEPPSRRRSWPLRPTLVVAVVLVLGSLLFVAGAQAYLTQQSVRLGQVQSRLQAQVGEHRDLELRVAQLSNPSHVVSSAQRQGLTVPRQVTDLPEVTVPPPAPPTKATTSSRSSSSADAAKSVPSATAHRAHRVTRARSSGVGSR